MGMNDANSMNILYHRLRDFGGKTMWLMHFNPPWRPNGAQRRLAVGSNPATRTRTRSVELVFSKTSSCSHKDLRPDCRQTWLASVRKPGLSMLCGRVLTGENAPTSSIAYSISVIIMADTETGERIHLFPPWDVEWSEAGKGSGVMEETDVLKRSLRQIDGALLFLLLIILSVILSYWSTRIQRGQLSAALRGEREVEAAPSVFPIRYSAAALVVGSLGFFLCLALDVLRQTREGDDPAALRSARTNAFASALVLSAALLRFDDLLFVEGSRQALLLEEQDLPA